MVRASRRGAQRSLLIGGLVLLVGVGAVAAVALDLGDSRGGNDNTELIEDSAGVSYRVPTTWDGDDSNPPEVLWREDDNLVLRITHFSSGESDAVDALLRIDLPLCPEGASALQGVTGADGAARCDNRPEDIEGDVPATAVGVLDDGEFWLIQLYPSSQDVRDDFVASLDFNFVQD